MKRKNIGRLLILAVAIQLSASCSSDFLEVKPKGTDLESNYYKNEAEAFNGLVAIYDVVGWQGGGYVTKIGTANVASDDHYAGGGNANDITDYQVMSNYTLSPAVGPQGELWKAGFSGVFRANVLLQKLPNVPMPEATKARFMAEAKFLRAYFYFDLVRLFRNVPLLTTPVSTEEMYNVLQAAPADVYKQIEQDLQEALSSNALPDQVLAGKEEGRATSGAAHALLGKVYLYQQKWADAARELAEVNGTPGERNARYGYKLLDNFGDLWKASNKFNSESIFEIAHNSTSGGDWSCISCTEGNILNILMGPRGYTAKKAGAPDYVAGWSFIIVTPDLFNAIHHDPRYKYTIANLDSLKSNGIADYTPGYMNTGYFMEKFLGRERDRSTGAGAVELNFPQNMYDTRLADTYLMEAEALVRGAGDMGRAQRLLDAVRKRVGLGSIPVTVDNILNERRLELAGEGHRWFDLIRTGKAAEVLKSKGFVAEKHEVLPIPLLEMDNTKIEQNKEYGGTK
ncbi:RagB/SusD family nutrient uptake outer membrane protein [Arcticibacter sp. MXS-1]|uniref:RagB/SusD family nutrient uptake outer membrane protein n=1 Tax=Arcticibacter sp. MXS-1 TaxID=3341726 RepID=UPI0035A93F01